MAERVWRVLVIDDAPQNTADARRELTEAFAKDATIRLEVAVDNDFDSGYERVRRGECDIVVLDVRRDKTDTEPEERRAGRRVFGDIQEARFLPVIFWTALPDEVIDKRMAPLVDVFAKDLLERVPDAIRAAIASEAAQVMSEIEDSVARVMREHMWQELAPHWEEDTAGGTPSELAHILISRVAQALQDQSLPELTAQPHHCYLYPPVSERFRPGELLLNIGAGTWSVLLTPECDLAHDNKADFALLGRAGPLHDFPKYTKWADAPSNSNWSTLESVLVGRVARYRYLPKFRAIPDLILDLEDTESVPIADLLGFERVASLVSPYSESLLTQHSHFRGRIGTPDLDAAALRDRLLTEQAAPDASGR